MNEKHAKALRAALRSQDIDPSAVAYSDKRLPDKTVTTLLGKEFRIPRFIRTLRFSSGRGVYQAMKRIINKGGK